MIKIFVTGDNHIGLKYASHPQSAVLAAARLEAFAAMVETANAQQCGLFVITGDLFENTYGIAKKDMEKLAGMLSLFQGTVVVLPGNHDYYDGEGKLWQQFQDVIKTKDNILLLTEYRPYRLLVNDAEVMLYPAFCASLHSAPEKNNLGWIKEQDMSDSHCYHIGIAHGAVEGETIDSEGQYFLMGREELERIPVDVWLLGHTHVPFPQNLGPTLAPTEERIFNPGTHVQTDVSCNTAGVCFIIAIDDERNICAQQVVSGPLRFYRKNITLTAGEMETTLERELADFADNSVVDVILSGAVTIAEYEKRGLVLEQALSRFIEGTYSDGALSKLISEELIRREFPETSFSAGFLSALLDKPQEAQLAYELLKSLKEAK